MKRLAFLCVIALCAVVAFAIPAKPGLRAVQQPDGTTLMVQLIGDEYFHYHATSDGLPLVKNESGAYVYATMLNDRFVATDVMAHDPSLRNAEELHIISQLQPVKMPESAKQRMQQSNNRRAARAQERRKVLGVSGQTKGKQRGLVILVDYPDAKMSHTRDEFDAMLNQKDYSVNGSIGSLSDYFYDQSYGQLKIDFDVVGPFTVSKSIKYYGENDERGEDMHAGELVSEVVFMAHEAGTDFSQYDWTGDGNVDQVFFFYAGYAESSGAPDYTIWPHANTLELLTSRNDGNGPITLDGVTVDKYACASELTNTEGNNMSGIGTPAHEFSHCLGLPDFYATEFHHGSDIGVWSLMDRGDYNQDGYVPCAYTSYERMFCGWLNPVELTKDTRIENMRPITEAPEAYIIYNQANRNEYYLLENHQQSHNSDRYHAWDSGAYGHGMLVLHVDYDEAAWRNNTVNCSSDHNRMVVISANNIPYYSYYAGNNLIKGTTFPGSTGNTALTNISDPCAVLNNPNSDGICLMNAPITDITENDGGISFNFQRKEELPVIGLEEPAEVDTTSFVARWQKLDDALSYTLEVTDQLPPPELKPMQTMLYELDFTKIEPFASATEVSTERVDYKLDEYFNMEDWDGGCLYVAPQGMNLGSTEEGGGVLVTPSFKAPYDGKLTFEIGVAEDKDCTENLIVKVVSDSYTPFITEIERDGKRHVFTVEGIENYYHLTIFTEDKPLKIFYLSAQAIMIPEYSKVLTYENIKNTSFPLTGLRTNGRYSYRVKAHTLYGFTPWSEPKEVVLTSPVSIADVQESSTRPRTIYNLQGQRLSKPQCGINIIDGKKVMY